MTDRPAARGAGVILDRDGTLIDFYRDTELGVVTPAFHPDHVRLLPGVAEGLRLLQAAGYPLAIGTNQPDAAKGRTTREAIARTNDALLAALAAEDITIAALRVCLHHPEGGPGGEPALITTCACRKPKPGMLLDIAHSLGLEPAHSWMVGDTAHDLGAASAAGMRAALLMPEARCELCQLAGVPLGGLEPEVRAPRREVLAQRILASG